MKRRSFVPLLLLFAACGDPTANVLLEGSVERDLDVISGDTLRIGVIEDALTWEERTYGDAGLEWDLLTAFAEAHHLAMVPVPMDSLGQLRDALRLGRVDVIAAQLGEGTLSGTVIINSLPYAAVYPVALLRRPADAKRKIPVDTVQLPMASAFSTVDPSPGQQFTEAVPIGSSATASDLIDRVVLGKDDAVIVTHLAAARAMEQFPHLGGRRWSTNERSLVFALRGNAPKLIAALNAHLADEDVKSTLSSELDDLRFTERSGPYGSSTPAVRGDTISGFDKLFRRVADSLGLDWHLLAAIAFRESRFDSAAGSHMGAQGLMQLMPETAARFSGQSKPGLEGHVIGAAVYLRELDKLWQRSVGDRQQRQRFVLASYNAGEAHIQDAQRLAVHFGLRGDRWENHVERALLLLSCPRHWRKPPVRNGFCKGAETFRFVRNVIGTWAYFGSVPDEEVLPDTLDVSLPLDSPVHPTGTQVKPDTASGAAAGGG
ncbi:MAG: transglycosylase SLT domain-containing protein [Flavobacteriales bacterium]